MPRTSIASAILLLTGAVAGAQATSPKDVLDNARARAGAMTNTRIAFNQEIRNPLTGNSYKSHGIILIGKKGEISVTFDGTGGDRLVSDGETMWIYMPKSAPGQAVRLDAKGKRLPINPIDALRADGTNPRVEEEKSDLPGSRLIVMRTTGGNTPLSRFWIRSSDFHAKRIETTDANGLVRTIEIGRVTRGVKPPAKAFKFTPPKGVLVIEPERAGRIR